MYLKSDKVPDIKFDQLHHCIDNWVSLMTERETRCSNVFHFQKWRGGKKAREAKDKEMERRFKKLEDDRKRDKTKLEVNYSSLRKGIYSNNTLTKPSLRGLPMLSSLPGSIILKSDLPKLWPLTPYLQTTTMEIAQKEEAASYIVDIELSVLGFDFLV